jgi:3-oxoacyl-[acyl-carrier protein] reductase
MPDKTAEHTGLPLEGKIALVTGAAGGMGGAVCAYFEGVGAVPVGLDLLAGRPDVNGSDVPNLWHCDVGDEANVAHAIDEIEGRFGRLDFIVHCAALPQGGVVWKLPVTEWDRILRVNLRSAFLLAHHAIPLIRRGAAGGRIVLIGSTSGSQGRMGQCAYAASKAGLLGFAKSVARETARFEILVNVVEPGITRTAMSAGMPEDLRAAAIAETLLGRMAEPEDIAATVGFLCGPGGRHITGQVIRVDGGEYM